MHVQFETAMTTIPDVHSGSAFTEQIGFVVASEDWGLIEAGVFSSTSARSMMVRAVVMVSGNGLTSEDI
jgi:hypothetical protein